MVVIFLLTHHQINVQCTTRAVFCFREKISKVCIYCRGPILQQLWYVLAVQTCGSFAAFFMGRVACLTMIQPHSFSFPLALVTPIIAAVSAALGVFKQTGKGSGLLNFLGESFQTNTELLFRRILCFFLSFITLFQL